MLIWDVVGIEKPIPFLSIFGMESNAAFCSGEERKESTFEMALEVEDTIKMHCLEPEEDILNPLSPMGSIKDQNVMQQGMISHNFCPLWFNEPGHRTSWVPILDMGDQAKPPRHVPQ
jgi:hypothetical protein